MPLENKVKKADIVINNSGSLETLSKDELPKKIMEIFEHVNVVTKTQ